jgi:hypothetical protein
LEHGRCARAANDELSWAGRAAPSQVQAYDLKFI